MPGIVRPRGNAAPTSARRTRIDPLPKLQPRNRLTLLFSCSRILRESRFSWMSGRFCRSAFGRCELCRCCSGIFALRNYSRDRDIEMKFRDLVTLCSPFAHSSLFLISSLAVQSTCFLSLSRHLSHISRAYIDWIRNATIYRLCETHAYRARDFTESLAGINARIEIVSSPSNVFHEWRGACFSGIIGPGTFPCALIASREITWNVENLVGLDSARILVIMMRPPQRERLDSALRYFRWMVVFIDLHAARKRATAHFKNPGSTDESSR
jgi:hypothetical protein